MAERLEGEQKGQIPAGESVAVTGDEATRKDTCER